MDKSKRRDALLKATLKMSERQLRLQICKMMLYKGYWGGKINTVGVFSKKAGGYYQDRYVLRGITDLLFFKRGRIIGIETKVGKNVQSEYQKQFQEHFHNPKLLRFYILAYDWNDVEKVLKTHCLD